ARCRWVVSLALLCEPAIVLLEARDELIAHGGHAFHLLLDEGELLEGGLTRKPDAGGLLRGVGVAVPFGPALGAELLRLQHPPDVGEREAEEVLELLDPFEPLDVL